MVLSGGIAAFALWVLLAAISPPLGVSASLGSASFALSSLSSKGLSRRSEVALLFVSLVVPVLFGFASLSWLTNFGGRENVLALYHAGTVVPIGALALSLYGRLWSGKGRSSRAALVLAVLSCGLYAAPAVANVLVV